MTYKTEYSKYLQIFNEQLDLAIKCLSSDVPEELKDAMIYSVDGGGKRVRPVLCLATTEILGADIEKAKKFAVALEMIHGYSLVHDDLPAMDNDDYRRGKLSTHKKFGEAIGILAGDALLNFAFEYCLLDANFDKLDVQALKILAENSGAKGMIAGQIYDMRNDNRASYSEEELYMVYNKTINLLTAPLTIASALSGGKHFDKLKELGYHLGALFQIVDDIMDVECTLEDIGKSPNKDLEQGKLTSIRVFGLDGAKDRAKFHYQSGKEILAHIENSEFLSEFLDAMYLRRK
ncbi:MAG: polyprenyl synthetase family protein [Clostridia bacterium]|nr:polyprenyl synthetase family protein [Clostridia bacterium]